ncbi:MAG: carboxypeptidase-like regulatory domain-containing protein [Cyclobacteriaceae bacterium]|nr:carboxypeptidase-like regulatory domain-containing protein [Cyclobacteriaceae bacterium]
MKAKRTLLLLTALLLVSTTLSIGQSKLPTSLKITVIDGLGNVVENATVTIYKTKEDYLESKNAVATLQTNEKGIAHFKKLQAITYFIDARKEDMSNDGAGAESDPLNEGRINLINTVIN